MTNRMQYTGKNSNRLLSPGLWGRNLYLRAQEHRDDGIFVFDDFLSGGAALGSNQSPWRGRDGLAWSAFGTTGVTHNQAEVAADGLAIGELHSTLDADTEESYLTIDATYGAPLGKISSASGKNQQLWFETRVKFFGVAAKMVGLAENGLNATGTIASGGASVGNNEFVGFRALAADALGMDAVHIDNAAVVVAEAADEPTLVIELDVYTKFGLHYDGKEVSWYINGEPITPKVKPTATNFPDGAMLVPFLGVRQVGAGDSTMTVDWVAMSWMRNP